MDYKQMAVINERKLRKENERLRGENFELINKNDVLESEKENLTRTLEEAGDKIEELEGQFAYECECNKQFVETQNKCERLENLLYNVCSYMVERFVEDERFFTAEHSNWHFGMTEEEHKKYILGEQNGLYKRRI